VANVIKRESPEKFFSLQTEGTQGNNLFYALVFGAIVVVGLVCIVAIVYSKRG
jgi:hypothetical protein